MPKNDWEDNLEFRIIQLEEWKDRHEMDSKMQIVEAVEFKLNMKNLKESNDRQEAELKEQAIKLSKMGTAMTKMVIGVLTTVCLTLLKFVLDYIIKLPK